MDSLEDLDSETIEWQVAKPPEAIESFTSFNVSTAVRGLGVLRMIHG
jgi:hypothetical protein